MAIDDHFPAPAQLTAALTPSQISAIGATLVSNPRLSALLEDMTTTMASSYVSATTKPGPTIAETTSAVLDELSASAPSAPVKRLYEGLISEAVSRVQATCAPTHVTDDVLYLHKVYDALKIAITRVTD